MNPFPKLHGPHWRAPPGVMSCEEIRWWMRELRRRGWKRGVMGRTLGYGRLWHETWRKADGKEWIYPAEQIRFSRQLRRIISGELVLKARTLRGKSPKKGQPSTRDWDAVLADNPVPLVPRHFMRYNMKTRRVEWVVEEPPENPLPNFRTVLQNMYRGRTSCP